MVPSVTPTGAPARSAVIPRRRRLARLRPNVALPVLLALLAAVSSSWTGLRIAGLQLSDAAIILSLGALLTTVAMRRVPIAPPVAALVPPFVAFIVAAIGIVVRGQGVFSQESTKITSYSVGSAAGDSASGPLPFLIRVVISLTFVALICHFSSVAYGRRTLVHLLVAWAIGAAISAATAIFEYSMGMDGLPFLFHVTAIDRSVGLAFHPNSLAQSATMALPVLLYFALANTGVRRIFFGVLVGVTVLGLFYSGSRGGLVLGAASLMAAWGIALAMTKRYTLAVVTVLGGLVAILTVLPKVLERTRFGSGDTTATQSTSLRVGILEYGWDLFSNNPLIGAGVGTWVGESVPLIMLTSGGLVLLVAFYTPFVTVAATVAPRAKELFGMTMLLMIVVLFVYGFTNNGFGERYVYWPMFIGFEFYRRSLTGTARPDVSGARSAIVPRGRRTA